MRVLLEHHSTPEIVQGKLEEAIAKALQIGGGQITQIEYVWAGGKLDFSFAIMSKFIKGTAEITDTQIIVNAGLPIMFKPFESKVKSRIIGTLNEMFSQTS